MKAQRKQAEKELQEWINTFDTFVGKFDPNGVGIIFNEAPLKGGGVTKDEVVGKYFPDTKWWSHSEIERAKIIECLEKAKAGLSSRIETNFRSADGTPVPIIFNCQPVMDDEGNVKYITAEGKTIIEETRLRTELQEAKKALETRVRERNSELVEAIEKLKNEIAERKRAEETLKKSETRLAEAQKIAHLGNWDWDIVTNDIYWSDEIYRIFGLRPQEFGATYEAFLDMIHPEDREFVKRSVSEALSKNKHYSIDHRIVLPSGEVRIVHEQAAVTFDESGKSIRMVGTVQDITERKQAEEEMRRALELEKQFKMDAAHYFFNPLAIARGYLELVIEEVPEEHKEKLKAVRHAVARVEKVVKNVTQKGEIP